MDDIMFWVAVKMDCFRPTAGTEVRVTQNESYAMGLGSDWLVYEKLPGIEIPTLVPYEQRRIEVGS